MIRCLKNLIKYRDLTFSLFYREISGRYKQSLLGIAWAVIQPFFLMVIFTFIKNSGAINISSNGLPYPIFTYAALIPWTFFTNSICYSAPSLIKNAPILKKIYFPREIFIIASVMASLFDFMMAFLVYIGLIVYYRIYPSFLHILLIPVFILIESIIAFGLGLIIAGLGVYWRDFVFGVPFLIQFGLFLSPVMYSITSIPSSYQTLYLILNPMAGIIEGYRQILLNHTLPSAEYLLYPALLSVLIFIFSYNLFKKLEVNFADVV